MTLPISSYTASQGKWDVEEIMDDIADSVTAYGERLENIENAVDLLEDLDAVDKYAHLEAFNLVSEKALGFLEAEIKAATAITREFNHPIFTEQMENALAEHGSELIRIEADENIPGIANVTINMYALGNPEDWIEAVKEARGSLGLGNITDNKIRSKIWKEIYQIDREAGTKIHPRTDEDVTERYVGKYFRTISERLTSISPDKAPWWYFINFGNKVSGEVGENAATPYPEYDPTNFVVLAELAIEAAFLDTFRDLRDESERVYSDLLEKDYPEIEVTNVTTGGAFRVGVEIDGDDLIERIIHAETNKTIDVVEYNNVQWDLYITSTGKLGRRYSLAKNR